MKKIIILLLISLPLMFFIGCEKNKQEQNNNKEMNQTQNNNEISNNENNLNNNENEVSNQNIDLNNDENEVSNQNNDEDNNSPENTVNIKTDLTEDDDPVQNEVVPNYTLTKKDGSTAKLHDYLGKGTLIMTIWSETCPYCIKEIPVLNSLNETEGISVISLLYGGDEKSINKLVKDNNINYDVFIEDGTLLNKFYVSGYPTSLLFDKGGNYLGGIPGYVDEADFKSILEQIKSDN